MTAAGLGGFSAVLLAAGLSRRMGTVNKLLVPVAGVPLVRRSAELLCSLGLEQVVVVLGHESDLVSKALSDLEIEPVLNEHFERGQKSSVRMGFRSAERANTAVLVCLADQIWLQRQHLHALCEAFVRRPSGSILVPRVHGKRGNPVVFSPSAVRRCLYTPDAESDRPGPLVGLQDPEVHCWDTESTAFTRDVDEPTDLPPGGIEIQRQFD